MGIEISAEKLAIEIIEDHYEGVITVVSVGPGLDDMITIDLDEGLGPIDVLLTPSTDIVLDVGDLPLLPSDLMVGQEVEVRGMVNMDGDVIADEIEVQ